MDSPAPDPIVPDPAAVALARILAIMARLRDPADGCEWDRAQSFATIAPYTIEEAYEVADAIDQHGRGMPGALDALRDELGDLLFQVVFHARMAEELGAFDFAGVADAISDKMIRRHPHIFGGEAASAGWEAMKAAERAKAAEAAGRAATSVLDGVPLALPALARADKLQRRAARVGFDWPDADAVLPKIDEEMAEIAEARTTGDAERISDEVGDLLFSAVNLARKLNVDPEVALKKANSKFEGRFRGIEDALRADGRTPEQSSLDEMEALWQRVKHRGA
ncbi:ATP diphosphatase [Stella humosa]|uniref:Nucleoside triphosphate pyrophosphohydrolase n=2 Tax=Stella humosa TaxID=94 RepID=A0A3N1MCX6_9PROT|nr:ATP diphosphatase [Stella humosa]